MDEKSGVMAWMPISGAPFDRDLELAVIDRDGVHALVFPCRRILGGWMKKETGERIEVHPSHWREWQQGGQPPTESLLATRRGR